MVTVTRYMVVLCFMEIGHIAALRNAAAAAAPSMNRWEHTIAYSSHTHSLTHCGLNAMEWRANNSFVDYPCASVVRLPYSIEMLTCILCPIGAHRATIHQPTHTHTHRHLGPPPGIGMLVLARFVWFGAVRTLYCSRIFFFIFSLCFASFLFLCSAFVRFSLVPFCWHRYVGLRVLSFWAQNGVEQLLTFGIQLHLSLLFYIFCSSTSCI